MSYTLRIEWQGGPYTRREPLDATIVLVGCGGTGGFLATAIARLLIGRCAQLYLIDHDRVAPENLGRQNFVKADLGRFKAEVLAERTAHEFGIPVAYSVMPYDRRLHQQAFEHPSRLALIVGAVDNAAARSAIASTLKSGQVLWLDAGNGYASGQVLLGNALKDTDLHHAFNPAESVCFALPAPSLQRPDLLDAPPQPVQDAAQNCAVAVAHNEQSATINQMMAAVTASYVEQLLTGTCGHMATYVDLDNGTIQSVPADPQYVAPLIGKPARYLIHKPKEQAA